MSLPQSRRTSLVVLLSASLASAAFAQAPQMFKPGPGPDELWDVTMKMEMAGMPMAMPAQQMQVCKRKDAGGEKFAPQKSDCQTTNVKTTGNKTTFDFACNGKDPMTGSGTFVATGDTYQGTMHMKGGRKGEEIDMTQTMSGRKVGTCTDTSQQQIAAYKAQADDAQAKSCQQMLDGLFADGIFAANSTCAAQRKPFCDKVGGLASSANTPAGFRAARAKYDPMTMDKAFTACGRSFADTQRAACASGVSSRDWAFVGSGSCDDDVRVAGDAQCKGRSYTGMDRSIVPLCNRYASLMRGSGMNAAQPAPAPAAAQAAPTPVNPVEQGINQVKKLLPF